MAGLLAFHRHSIHSTEWPLAYWTNPGPTSSHLLSCYATTSRETVGEGSTAGTSAYLTRTHLSRSRPAAPTCSRTRDIRARVPHVPLSMGAYDKASSHTQWRSFHDLPFDGWVLLQPASDSRLDARASRDVRNQNLPRLLLLVYHHI